MSKKYYKVDQGERQLYKDQQYNEGYSQCLICEECHRPFRGFPFYFTKGEKLKNRKKNGVMFTVCNKCRDKFDPLKSGEKRKSNLVYDLMKESSELREKNLPKREKKNLICEECKTPYYGAKVSFSTKIKSKIVSKEVALCENCVNKLVPSLNKPAPNNSEV